MARLLIVSRSMALAMRLADQHEVIEHPVDELDGLLEGIDETTDVLVLDLGDPVLAVNTVNSLREAEHDTPVLLVSGYQPEWEQVEAQEVEGVHVVPLPITRVALLQGIAILTGEEAAITFFESDDVVLPVIPPLPEPEPVDGGGADGNQPRSGAGRPVPVAGAFGPAGAGGAFGPGGPGGTGGAFGPAGAAPGWVPSRQVVGTGEVPAVTESDVAGVAYSTAITRPFVEEPRTGQFSYPPPPVRPPAGPTGPQRWLRGTPAEPPPPAPAVPNGTGANGDGRRSSLLGNRPRKLQRHPNVVAQPGSPVAPAPYTPTGMGLVTDPLGPRTDPYGFPSSALDRRLDAEAASLASSRPSAGDNGSSLRTADLVRLLHERAGDLYGVSDTAQVLADDVIERASADAAAILVPDGPIWRVSGGVGLRPLERRLVLEDSHWLITEIGSAGRAVLIEDTDIIRQQLSGAPLAAWRHLLAVPVPDVRAIVVLARGSEGGPFTDRDLSAVIAPVREAAALLAQAVQTRRLARVLSPLRESEPDSPTRPRSFP